MNLVYTSARISEADWVGRIAQDAFEEGYAAGKELIEQHAARFRDLQGIMRSVFKKRPHVYTPPRDSIISSFSEFGNKRVIWALKYEAIFKHARQTLHWSDLYERAARVRGDLSEQQERELKLLVPRLKERLQETLNFVKTPVKANTDIHQLFVSVATLGLINQETMCLAGKTFQKSMLKALSALSRNAYVYLRHAAAISLVRQAVSLRGMTPMLSDAARGWARAMRVVAQMHGRGNPECDRDSMMESLLEHSGLLEPYVGRGDVQIMASAILAVRNNSNESEYLRSIAGHVFKEMLSTNVRMAY